MSKFFGTVKRAILKTVYLPFVYGKKKDYDAKKYWHDRFVKYNDSIVGPGSEALSEDENNKMYDDAKNIFLNVCDKQGIDFKKNKICEIGLGNGFYTEVFNAKGTLNYCGYDIADVLIPKLSNRFPQFKFKLKDISTESIDDKYDFITLIDVLQHIVNEDKCEFALKNIAEHLNVGGTFFIGPLTKTSKKILFYVHGWSIDKIRTIFKEPHFAISEPIDFRNDCAYIIKKNS
jgi:2-polyprenyl-3-methyl-5-hydroxy-6-metoxy-1,4-benzoquinol methylase